MKTVAIKMMTLVACGARTPPLNPICADCGELRCMHKGDRLKVDPVPCKCDVKDFEPGDASKRKAASPGTAPDAKAKKTKSFANELDPDDRQYMSDVYERKTTQIANRYPGLEPKVILKKLIGSDVSIDDPVPNGRAGVDVGVTGEQGGRLLACYLFKLENDTGTSEDITSILNVDSAEAWLTKAGPCVLLRPAAKLCVEKATAFLPKLRAGLLAAATSDDEGDEGFGDLFE